MSLPQHPDERLRRRPARRACAAGPRATRPRETSSVTSRPLTVGLQIFSSTDQGVDWSIITAATLLTSGPLLVAFLLFQRQFVQSFMRAGIR